MASKRERDIYTAGHQRRVSNQNISNKSRKSTDTSANSGKTINRPKTVYFRSKDDARPVYKNPAKQKTVSRPRYTGKGRTTPKLSGWYAQPKQTAQPKAKAGDEGVYVSPPDWTWADDVKALARRRRNERIKARTNDARILYANPLDQLKQDTAPDSDYRMRQDAMKLKSWLNGRGREYPEDRGTTLAQVNRLASLYRAVDPITQGFSREHAGELHKDIQDAPVNLQELYIRYGDGLSPVVNTPGLKTEYYDPGVGAGRVYGDQAAMEAGDTIHAPGSALWHEYGHNLDWLAGNRKSNYMNPQYSARYTQDGMSLESVIQNDMDRSMRDYWQATQGDEPYDPQKAVRYFSNGMKGLYGNESTATAPLSDMMGPYSLANGGTTHPLGAGHYEEYLQDEGTAIAEAFANLSSTSVQGGDQLRLIQAVLPNTYGAYLDMLGDMTADDPYSRQNTVPQYYSTRKKRWPF